MPCGNGWKRLMNEKYALKLETSQGISISWESPFILIFVFLPGNRQKHEKTRKGQTVYGIRSWMTKKCRHSIFSNWKSGISYVPMVSVGLAILLKTYLVLAKQIELGDTVKLQMYIFNKLIKLINRLQYRIWSLSYSKTIMSKKECHHLLIQLVWRIR